MAGAKAPEPPAPSRLVHVGVQLSADLRDRFEAEARRRGFKTTSAALRQAMAEWLGQDEAA